MPKGIRDSGKENENMVGHEKGNRESKGTRKENSQHSGIPPVLVFGFEPFPFHALIIGQCSETLTEKNKKVCNPLSHNNLFFSSLQYTLAI